MRPSLRWRASALLLAGALSSGLAAAQPGPKEKEQAKALFQKGLELAEQGRWADALQSFQESDRVVPLPVVKFNVATTLRALGRYADAKRLLEELSALPRNPRATRAEARKETEFHQEVDQLLSEVRGSIVKLRLLVDPPDASVELDGTPLKNPSAPLELDPGKHVFVIKKEGHETTSISKTLSSSDHEIELRAPKARVIEKVKVVEKPVEIERPFYRKGWFWAASGAVILGAAAVLFVVNSRQDPREPPSVPASTLDRVIPATVRF